MPANSLPQSVGDTDSSQLFVVQEDVENEEVPTAESDKTSKRRESFGVKEFSTGKFHQLGASSNLQPKPLQKSKENSSQQINLKAKSFMPPTLRQKLQTAKMNQNLA